MALASSQSLITQTYFPQHQMHLITMCLDPTLAVTHCAVYIHGEGGHAGGGGMFDSIKVPTLLMERSWAGSLNLIVAFPS